MLKGPNLTTIRERLEKSPKAILDQLPALQECITTRWEVYAKHGSCVPNIPECQLCDKNPQCNDCVIGIVTGKEGCRGTPFVDWYDISSAYLKAEQECANLELAFLRRVATVLIELIKVR